MKTDKRPKQKVKSKKKGNFKGKKKKEDFIGKLFIKGGGSGFVISPDKNSWYKRSQYLSSPYKSVGFNLFANFLTFFRYFGYKPSITIEQQSFVSIILFATSLSIT